MEASTSTARDQYEGEPFYFKLNSVPIFIKGANYIPPDSFPTRVSDERIRYILESAKSSNMNMVRQYRSQRLLIDDLMMIDTCLGRWTIRIRFLLPGM